MNPEQNYRRTGIVKDIFIPEGDNYSTMVDCGGMFPAGLIIPPTFDSADISFYVSFTEDFNDARPITYINGTNFVVNGTAGPKGNYIPLQPYFFIGGSYIWVFINTPQVGDSVLQFNLQPYFQGVHG